ncbi:MAG: Crp/Fnr family transcriptional regulator [Rhodospirillaceae bacterium]|nr:Crp/Fnr family transcriptional regulator [Rhodospirillaceae bacterium]
MRDSKAQSLSGIKLLNSLTESDLKKLEQRCNWRLVGQQEIIVDRQSKSSDVYFIVSGKVRVVNFSLSGREITFDEMTAGGYFGQLAALDNQPRSENVVALEDSVLASLSQQPFKDLLLEYPKIALELLVEMAQIIRTSTDRIMDLSTIGAHNRVHAEILRLAQEEILDDNTAKIEPVPIHGDVASRVSTTRETVARVFSDLTKRKLMERKDNALIINDLEVLHDIVEEFRRI